MVCETKKRTRVILILCGVVLIIVGVLCGQLLVRFMRTKVKDKNCLPTDKAAEGFIQWTAKSLHKTSVTFWSITNREEFLYQGKFPKFEERGPYIYTTTTKKVDIGFHKGSVSFKTYTTQEFNTKLTHEKCPGCNQSDQVTVLNTAYIGLMAQFKGDRAFSVFMIPNIVNGYLQQLLTRIPDQKQAYSYLGNYQVSDDKKGVPAFGPWLRENPILVEAIINKTRKGKSYNWTEMKALYNVLRNASLLLPSPMSNTMNPLAKGNGLLSYLTTYNILAHNISNASNVNKTILKGQMQTLIAQMNELLCPNITSMCFHVNDSHTIQALALFISSHLAGASMHFLDENNYGILVSRPVHELVFGYTMSKLPLPPKYPLGVPVPGFLVNHNDEADASKKGKAVSLFTCEADSAIHGTWAAYDGKTMMPQSYYPNALPDELKITGYHTSQFSATEELSPCTNKYPATATHFDIFVQQIYQQLRLKYQKPQTTYGIYMNRYVLDQQKLKTNNRTVFMDGILDVSNVRGIPVSISAPGFLYCHPSVYNLLSMKEPTMDDYGTIVDVEPVTGRPMNLQFRIQINSLIKEEIISAKRLRQLNITFYEIEKPYTKYFPIYWTEEGAKITKEAAVTLQNELLSNFSVSCTISVVLPVIGGLLLLTGLILVVLTFKRFGTVTPPNADQQS